MSYSLPLQHTKVWLQHIPKNSFHSVVKNSNLDRTITVKKKVQNPSLYEINVFNVTIKQKHWRKYQVFQAGSNFYSNQTHEPRKTENEGPLTKSQANDLILRLTEDERKTLSIALQQFSSNQIKSEYEGQLAATRWRSKLGRPSKLPTLGDVDPTGSYCHLPDDWLKKKYGHYKYRSSRRVENLIRKIQTEQVPRPSKKQLVRVAICNAVPFIGFGFLDNFIMIVAGDYIDLTVGSMIAISTMAAAALGNTISDVMGIGSAWYVEMIAAKIGLKQPNLSPVQLDMKPTRAAANLGRTVGVIVGCLLGMVPLLFIKTEEKKTTTV